MPLLLLVINHPQLQSSGDRNEMSNYFEGLTTVQRAYHFSYKILLLISAPVCHPNFSQSVPCSHLSFPGRREIDKHSLRTREIKP